MPRLPPVMTATRPGCLSNSIFDWKWKQQIHQMTHIIRYKLYNSIRFEYPRDILVLTYSIVSSKHSVFDEPANAQILPQNLRFEFTPILRHLFRWSCQVECGEYQCQQYQRYDQYQCHGYCWSVKLSNFRLICVSAGFDGDFTWISVLQRFPQSNEFDLNNLNSSVFFFFFFLQMCNFRLNIVSLYVDLFHFWTFPTKSESTIHSRTLPIQVRMLE